MADITPDVLIFWVDFNNVDAGGQIKGSFAHASSNRVPDVGERVLLYDAEGNACWGTVTHVGKLVLRFQPDMATWTSGEELSATGVPVTEQPVFEWRSDPVPA